MVVHNILLKKLKYRIKSTGSKTILLCQSCIDLLYTFMIDMYIFDFQTYWSSSKKGNKKDLCDIEASSEASGEI